MKGVNKFFSYLFIIRKVLVDGFILVAKSNSPMPLVFETNQITITKFRSQEGYVCSCFLVGATYNQMSIIIEHSA